MLCDCFGTPRFAGAQREHRVTDDVTRERMAEILDVICRRAPFLWQVRFYACAWTDSAPALIELEVPVWHIQRIVYGTGDWHCALSRQREFPDWLDQAVKSGHANLELAHLSTFVKEGTLAPPTGRAFPTSLEVEA